MKKTNLLGLFGGYARRAGAAGQPAGPVRPGGAAGGTAAAALCFSSCSRLERLRQTGAKLPSSGSGREGGVSILSIHRSKGLEKPVVLVCSLSRRLNRDDLMRPVLFHPVLGVGPKGAGPGADGGVLPPWPGGPCPSSWSGR